MQQYELTLVLNNSLDEKARKEVLDSVAKNFSDLKKQDLWGVRGLTYPIKHQDKAFYAYFEFEAESGQINSLDKTIKLNEDIIRHLLVKVLKAKKPKKVKVKLDSEAKPAIESEEETLKKS